MSKHYSGGYLVDENGKPYGVKHIDNKLVVSNFPFLYDVAAGNIAGKYGLNKFGNNADVGATFETIWTNSSLYPYMTVADQLEVLSSDGNDDNTDTGAWTVKIEGLDANWDLIDDTVTLDGANPVTTTKSFLRVFLAEVVTAGSSHVNEGTITIRDQDTDTTRAAISPRLGRSLMAMWTVPADYQFNMTAWYGSSAVAKAIQIGVWSRNNGIANASFRSEWGTSFVSDVFFHTFPAPIIYPEKTDIEVRALAIGAAGSISSGFSGWYELV